MRNWEPIGSGSFIGTALAADFFRMSAYVYENYYPPTNRGNKVYLTINRRVTNRFILNLDKFIQKINQKLLDYVTFLSILTLVWLWQPRVRRAYHRSTRSAADQNRCVLFSLRNRSCQYAVYDTWELLDWSVSSVLVLVLLSALCKGDWFEVSRV